jgi:hypothetical protein
MSLTMSILAFVAGLAAKLKPEPEARVKRLMTENRELAYRVRQLECELQDAENRAMAAEAEVERLHARNAQNRRMEIQREYAALANRMNAQMAQQRPHLAAVNPIQWQEPQALAQRQGLLGAQNLQGALSDIEWRCTCIPDRASAFRGRR